MPGIRITSKKAVFLRIIGGRIQLYHVLYDHGLPNERYVGICDAHFMYDSNRVESQLFSDRKSIKLRQTLTKLRRLKSIGGKN